MVLILSIFVKHSEPKRKQRDSVEAKVVYLIHSCGLHFYLGFNYILCTPDTRDNRVPVKPVNAYFVTVLLAVILFYIVWFLGWVLERLSHTFLTQTSAPGSKGWYFLVGPGVALHESSHALGCLITGAEIVEFKPISVERMGDEYRLGYVKYRNPASDFKKAVINLAPVAVSLLLLTLFAAAVTYLVPGSPGIGGQALELIADLVTIKADPILLADTFYPVQQIVGFIYTFLYTLAGLSVLHPAFWLIAFIAMTVMFSNAPSNVDIANAANGLKAIILFDLFWLAISFFVPIAGWFLPGIFEVLAVLFALALAFALVGYGFFVLVVAMSRIKKPLQILPFVLCLLTGGSLMYLGFGTVPFQTVISLAIFAVTSILLVLISRSGKQ